MFKTLSSVLTVSATWYVHKFVEILFPLERITAYLKEYLETKNRVHNNVRKWPNLCSIKPRNILERSKLMSFRPID